MADMACHSPSTPANAPTAPGPANGWVQAVVWSAILSAAGAVVGRQLLGPTLGLVLFVLVLACITTLAGWTLLSDDVRQCRTRWEALGLTLLLPLLTSALSTVAALGIGSAGQITGLLAVTASCTLALAGLIGALRAVRLPSPLAGLLVMLSVGVWLTLPVWLSPYWSSGLALDRLLDSHPLFAANALFAELGDWSHAPLAYNRLTNLNQDIPFALPTSIAWCLSAHVTAAAITIVFQITARRLWRSE